ncbi:MAG TPA: phosphodiester glycosidase family protein [Bacteroidales bacterium]|nr:phosphodiester glycosidase family protein [Bacteroidales bacterium]
MRLKIKIPMVILLFGYVLLSFQLPQSKNRFFSYTINPDNQDLRFFWKNDSGQILNTFNNLIDYTYSKGFDLVFAMNGGMYKTDYFPLGLYIENKKEYTPINMADAYGNFYLKPNGIFYLDTANKAKICESSKFVNNGDIKYATQSGPMLIVEGKIHPAFIQGSQNLHIRNGVGILPDGNVVFAISTEKVNFYDFAMFFKDQGCKNALYLDGFVSRMYLPEENQIKTDGKFGVFIGVLEKTSN